MLTVETTDVDPEGNESIWFGGKVIIEDSFFHFDIGSRKIHYCEITEDTILRELKIVEISKKEQIRSIYPLSCLINKGLRSQFRRLDIEQGQTKDRLTLRASGRNNSQHC